MYSSKIALLDDLLIFDFDTMAGYNFKKQIHNRIKLMKLLFLSAMSKTRNLLNNPFFYIGIVVVVNLLQSAFTKLANDEAYYWVFSQHLAWGYFDHPPASPVLIAMGYALFKNEFGVRLFIVLANALSIWCIWKMILPKNTMLFFAMMFSCIIAHFGFMAAPDSSLLVTVSVFLVLLKYYLENDNWYYTLALTLAVAAIGYSKYHGIVVLFFALLPNLYLLKRRSFWVIIIGATILLLPHFYWQYIHDFPTFRFHLFDRSPEPYRIGFIFEYLLGQLLVFGPFIGFILFWAAYKSKTEDRFDRTMKWCFYGIFGFFLFNSFRGRVEANWTATGMIPLLYLAYHYIENRENTIRWVYRIAVPTLVLVFAFRIVLAVDIFPKRVVRLSDEFHGWDKWAIDLKEIAGDTPVLFYNNYQRGSKYQFYANGNSHSPSTVSHAGNQYDLFIETEENLQGKDAFLFYGVPEDDPNGIWLGDKVERVKYDTLRDFHYTDRLRIKLQNPISKCASGERLTQQIDIINPTKKEIVFKGNNGKKLELRYFIFEFKKEVKRGLAIPEFPLESLKAGETKSFQIEMEAPDTPGKYRYRIAIYNGIFDEQNSNFQKLIVK